MAHVSSKFSINFSRGAGSAIALAALAILISASPVGAQTPKRPAAPKPPARSTDGYLTARKLGGPTAFHHPSLTTAASIKKMAGAKGMEADIRKVLADSGLTPTADAVVAMFSNASTSVMGGNCAAAKPADGALVECDFLPGSTVE